MIMPDYSYLIVHYSWSKDHDILDSDGIFRYHGSFRIDGHIVTEQEYITRKLAGDGKLFQRPWGNKITRCGYHYLVERYRQSWQCVIGRPLYKRGVHCAGMNSISIGVCFIGKYDDEAPDDEMIEFGVRKIIVPCMLLFPKITLDHIQPHSAYSSYKTCPGRQFPMESLRTLTKHILK